MKSKKRSDPVGAGLGAEEGIISKESSKYVGKSEKKSSILK